MAATPCESCAKPMSETAVACPHCGARQGDRAPEGAPASAPGPLAGAKLSREEMAALLAVEAANAPTKAQGPSLFKILLLPHPMTQGIGRVLDVVFTLAALPLLLNGMFLLLLFGQRRSFAVLTRGLSGNAELTAALFATVLGVCSAMISNAFLPLSDDLSGMALMGAGAAALLLRLAVRKMAERRSLN